MTEIEAKARQLARVIGAPAGSYYVCKEAIALEMAEWMEKRTMGGCNTSEELAKWLLDKAEKDKMLMDALWIIFDKFEHEI